MNWMLARPTYFDLTDRLHSAYFYSCPLLSKFIQLEYQQINIMMIAVCSINAMGSHI